MKKTVSVLTLAVALAFGLSACSDNGTVEKGGAETSATTEATETTAAAAESSELQFGDKYTYENGVSLSITKPAEYTPSEYAIGISNSHEPVVFEVTIENNSGEDYDPSMSYFTASSGGEESEQIFDSENGLDGGPTTTVKNGKSIKFKIGFSVADPSDITMDASADMFGDTKTFVN